MDNSMTEYKKKSKLADMIDSLKFNAKILFAGKNQDKIKAAIMEQDVSKRLGLLDAQADKLDDITDIVQSLPELDKMVTLRKYTDKIKAAEIGQIVMGLNDANKMTALENYSNKLDIQEIKALINSVDKGNKLKAISLTKDKLNSYDDIKDVMTGLDGKEKLEMLNMFGEQVKANNALTDFVMQLDSKDRLNIPDEYKKDINLKEVIKSLDKEDMEKAYVEHSKDLLLSERKEIIREFDFDQKSKFVNKEIGQVKYISDIKDILVDVYKEEEITEALPKYMDKLNSEVIKDIILSYPNDFTREELLLQNQNLLNEEHLMEAIKTLDDNGKFSILGRIDEERLSSADELRVIGSMEDEKVITRSLERGEYTKEADKGIAAKYISKLDERVLSQEKLLNQETIELLGEQEHYQLFKYIVIPGDGNGLDVSEALENPSKFKGYLQLRDYYKNQELAVQNLANGINEYNNHSEVINDVMESETITYEQIAILEDLVKDEPYNEIKGMEDLEKYPQLRKERFAREIEKDSKESMYKMLLGVSKEEFESISDTVSVENGLAKGLEEIRDDLPSEEHSRVDEVIAMLKVIELVEEMPEEQRKEVLNVFNEDLSKEFSEGSRVAEARGSMAGLKKDIREIFGKELSNALGIEMTEDTKKEILHEEGKDDIEVTHLEGEEFKLLVHAIGAYGKGNGHFQRGEIGKLQICMSLISDKFMGTAGGDVVLGFTDFEAETLIQEGSTNLFSNAGVKTDNTLNITGAEKNGFRKSDKLIEETVKNDEKYNEVDVYSEYMDKDGSVKKTVPSHIVCYNRINDKSKEEARLIAEKFGLDKPLPILLIHTEKYKDRIEEYAKEVRGEKQEEVQQEVVEEKQEEVQQEAVEEKQEGGIFRQIVEEIKGKSISQIVEEIMNIAGDRVYPKDIVKVQVEMINAQEKLQEKPAYKKPTAMMSKDDGIQH